MSQQTILAGQTGLEVRTILNENFTELYSKGASPFKGWGYQDFNSGVIDSTNITISGNDNGSGVVFDSLKIIGNTAAVCLVSDNLKVPHTGTTSLFSSKVIVSSHIGSLVTLSGIPNISWGSLRIYYYYNYDTMPIGYVVAPKFISGQILNELNTSFVTDEEISGTLGDIQTILDSI